jgi:hypothetical protein
MLSCKKNYDIAYDIIYSAFLTLYDIVKNRDIIYDTMIIVCGMISDMITQKQ